MHIRFNKTLDDFAAFQMFHAAHSNRKAPVSMVLIAILLLLILSCIVGENIYHKRYWLLGIVAIAAVIYIVFVARNQNLTSAMYYKQGEHLQKEGVDGLTGENTLFFDAEYFRCESENSQVKTSLGSIEKIVICPDYLFIYTNPVTAHYIPRGGITEGDLDAFTAGLTAAYQIYGDGQNKQTNVIRSDWVLDQAGIGKGLSYQTAAEKAGDIVLWAFIFGMGSVIVTLMIFGFIMYLAYHNGWVEQAEDVPGYIVYIVFGIPILIGFVGAFLAYRGKLPKIKLPFQTYD